MTITSGLKLTLLAAVAAISVSNCTKPATQEEALVNEIIRQKQLLPASAEEREAIKHKDQISQAAFWGNQFQLNPNDYEAATNYAKTLRAIGSLSRAVDVATQALAIFPGDVDLSKTLARAHLGEGRPERALHALYSAKPDEADWTLYSLYGVTLDQMGDHERAQVKYAKALELSPDNHHVLANYALSLTLQGNPEKAEQLLRDAIDTNARMDPRVRQNIVLVLGVQGKFDEAEEIAAFDQTPAAVERSVNYYRKLLTPQSRDWNRLSKSGSVPARSDIDTSVLRRTQSID